MGWKETEDVAGVDLFGDPVKAPGVVAAPRVSRGVKDRDLTESVLRTALGDGYAVIGHPARVYRCVGRGEIESVPGYESDVVSDLIDRDLLRIGGWHDYTCGHSAGRGRAVLVSTGTRTLLSRWATLQWQPT